MLCKFFRSACPWSRSQANTLEEQNSIANNITQQAAPLGVTEKYANHSYKIQEGPGAPRSTQGACPKCTEYVEAALRKQPQLGRGATRR